MAPSPRHLFLASTRQDETIHLPRETSRPVRSVTRADVSLTLGLAEMRSRETSLRVRPPRLTALCSAVGVTLPRRAGLRGWSPSPQGAGWWPNRPMSPPGCVRVEEHFSLLLSARSFGFGDPHLVPYRLDTQRTHWCPSDFVGCQWLLLRPPAPASIRCPSFGPLRSASGQGQRPCPDSASKAPWFGFDTCSVCGKAASPRFETSRRSSCRGSLG